MAALTSKLATEHQSRLRAGSVAAGAVACKTNPVALSNSQKSGADEAEMTGSSTAHITTPSKDDTAMGGLQLQLAGAID